MTHDGLSQTLWELSGLDVEGSQVASHPWDRPPRVRIVGDRLHWQYVVFAGDDDPDEEFPVGFGPISIETKPRPTHVRLGALLQFVTLPERGYRAISAFAAKWGVLHLCEHDVPRTHPQARPPLRGDEVRQGPYCESVYDMSIEGSEPLVGWLAWAQRARAVLNIATALRGEGKRIDLPAEWAVLLTADRANVAAKDAAAGREFLGREIEAWLQVGAVGPRIDLSAPPYFSVGGPELFGMLALQLASAVTGGIPSFCSSCGSAYVPKRQPTPGLRNYCDECRDAGVPGLVAARKYRRKRKKKERDAR